MSTRVTKKRKEIDKLFAEGKVYRLEDAIEAIKNAPRAKFDETVELSINLSLDPKDPAQAIRGTALLPHGTGRNVRVLVLCRPEDEKKAKEAGADFAGSEELIKKISGGWCDFDVAIATSSMMKEIAKLGRVLGPRGLMPNPKTGTVTDDLPKTIKEVKKGKIEFKMDKQGGIHVGAGKVSFEKEALRDNIMQLIKSIISSNQNMNKPQSIKSMFLSTTMGAGLRLDISEFKK
ncbi:MAG: 50S ribosomal protein L1 [Candidatus Omnitrophica bacterium]|nr:50S ribosomal protein L1 [Candidatus Omnitrophota bacterium]